MKRKTMRLRQQMLLLIAVPLILVVLLVSLVITAEYRRTITDELVSVRKQAVEQIAEIFNTKMAQIYSIVTLISEDEQLSYYFSQSHLSQEDYNYSQSYLFKSLADKYILYLGNPYIQFNLLLMGRDHLSYSSLADPQFDYDVYKELHGYGESLGSGGRIVVGCAFKDTRNAEIYARSMQENVVIPFFRSVQNPNTNRSRGVVVVNVPHSVILDSYRYLSSGNSYSRVYVVSREGDVVSAQESALLGGNVLDREGMKEIVGAKEAGYSLGKERLLLYSPVNNGRWMLIEEVDLRGYLRPVQTLQRAILLILALAVLAGAAISFFGARSLARPIGELSGRMRRVRGGQFELDGTPYKTRELLSLRDSFNQMQLGLRALMEQVRAEEQIKRRLELAVLQAQINPHFLYNSMFSIRCVAAMQGNEKVAAMLDSLIRLLRNSIGSTGESITVREEVAYLKDYLKLRQMGFSTPFEVEWAVEEELLERHIPRMLLQPLVENAVNHGIKPAGRPCTLHIEARREGEDILFSVSDDGVGMNDAKVREVLSGLSEERGGFSKVGLYNVNERLVLNYGADYALQIVSGEQEGATILLRVPLRDEDFLQRGESGAPAGIDRG